MNEHAGDQAREGPLKAALDALQRVLTQDLEPDPEGGSRIRRGVAKDRMPSLGDKEMRHGRQSKSKLFNGFKRHVVGLVGSDLIVGAVVRPANEPEHEAATPHLEDARRHGEIVGAIIDRGYLASTELLSMRQQGVAIRSKPWPSRNAGRLTEEDFAIPALGSVAHFPASACRPCSLRTSCTVATSGRGRSIAIHEHEGLLIELRVLRKTPEGRATLRERTAIEHRLARIGAVRGPRARHKGARKNALDVRRCAAIKSLEALRRAA